MTWWLFSSIRRSKILCLQGSATEHCGSLGRADRPGEEVGFQLLGGISEVSHPKTAKAASKTIIQKQLSPHPDCGEFKMRSESLDTQWGFHVHPGAATDVPGDHTAHGRQAVPYMSLERDQHCDRAS